jgi:hypothetical protein
MELVAARAEVARGVTLSAMFWWLRGSAVNTESFDTDFWLNAGETGCVLTMGGG